MKLTDLDLARYAVLCYEQAPQWDALISGDQDDDVYCGIVELPDVTVLALRGSSTPEDWMRDFFAAAHHETFQHFDIGDVHAGFFIGLPELAGDLHAFRRTGIPWAITGHSLGAARALLLAGLLTAIGDPISKVVALGPPRPAMHRLTEILTNVPMGLYRNLDDPVCGVPFALPWLPYEHPRPLMQLSAPPPADDPWGPIAAHHSELYIDALEKMFPAKE